jgi:hypothetical protein
MKHIKLFESFPESFEDWGNFEPRDLDAIPALNSIPVHCRKFALKYIYMLNDVVERIKKELHDIPFARDVRGKINKERREELLAVNRRYHYEFYPILDDAKKDPDLSPECLDGVNKHADTCRTLCTRAVAYKIGE